VIDQPAPTAGRESRRLAEAQTRAHGRVRRQRDTLRPLGWALVAVATLGAIGGRPQPGLHGAALGVTLALGAFAVATGLAVGRRHPGGHTGQVLVIAVMGGAGVALVALQSQGTTALAGDAAVWMAVTRLRLVPGLVLGGTIGVASNLAAAASGSSPAAVLAGSLVLVLLGVVAYFMKQSRASQDRTELLLAELEDARDEQAGAAAVAERSRIAGELHDVLAHSLSGAAIQLQAARKLAERDGAASPLRAAIDRAGELVKDGLANARQAVEALRGDDLPGVTQLDSLITSFRNDLDVDVTLSVEGAARSLPAEASLALYRAAQEALTNVARHAPGATARVVLRYGVTDTTLCIEDHVRPSALPRPANVLSGVGGGRGLIGLRDRVERVGGSAQAGPTDRGWRVELTVPA